MEVQIDEKNNASTLYTVLGERFDIDVDTVPLPFTPGQTTYTLVDQRERLADICDVLRLTHIYGPGLSQVMDFDIHTVPYYTNNMNPSNRPLPIWDYNGIGVLLYRFRIFRGIKDIESIVFPLIGPVLDEKDTKGGPVFYDMTYFGGLTSVFTYFGNGGQTGDIVPNIASYKRIVKKDNSYHFVILTLKIKDESFKQMQRKQAVWRAASPGDKDCESLKNAVDFIFKFCGSGSTHVQFISHKQHTEMLEKYVN